MSIQARIIGDSRNPAGVRLTSIIATYPRFIHSELMTHRAFSRNAASSRAIPLKKKLLSVEDSPAMPERWGGEQPGMQSGDEIEHPDKAEQYWLQAKCVSVDTAEKLGNLGLHKSLCNRLLEPFDRITTLITSTHAGLSNFFALRAHPAAQPEFQVLAYRMLAEYLDSVPKELAWGDWHIPQFENAPSELAFAHWSDRLKVATARCARLSYLTFDGDFSFTKDIELHDRLAASGHWSPFEHCAKAVDTEPEEPEDLLSYKMSNFDVGGLSGWQQYRKQFDNELVAVANLPEIMENKPEWITI